MKRKIAISLTFLYLLVSSGLVVTAHYCMGRLASVGFETRVGDACGVCGMDDSGCCHDDIRIFKTDDSHLATFLALGIPAPEPMEHAWQESTRMSAGLLKSIPSLTERGPPLGQTISRHVLLCVFRI